MPESRSAIASARVVATFTLLSRILGLVREQVLTFWFGTSEIFSAFRLAFMVPNLTRRLFGEGALSAALIPTLTEYLHEHGETASRRFVGALLVRLVVVLVALLVVAEVVVVVWRYLKDDLALELTSVLLPYMVLICLTAVLSGVLNVRRRFGLPAALPVILNSALIIAISLGGWGAGLTGKRLVYLGCLAALGAGGLQLIMVWISLRRDGFTPLARGSRGSNSESQAVSKVIGLMGPMAFGLSAVQFNALADYLIAYGFIVVDGERVGPAVLGTAGFLYQLPLGVFGIAIATAVFPSMARMATANDMEGLRAMLTRGLKLSLFIALPAAAGLMMVTEILVEALYERGEFGPDSTTRVAETLFYYSLGLVAYFANHVLVRTYYALKDSSTPARVAARLVVVNLAMNLALVGPMQERGLALATAVCAMLQTLVLWRRLPIPEAERRLRDIVSTGWRVVFATGVMAIGISGLYYVPFVRDLLLNSALSALMVVVPSGVIFFVVASRVLGIEELRMVIRPDRALD